VRRRQLDNCPQIDDKPRLDTTFGEALERFVGTRPAEVRANVAKSKKKKPPGGKKPFGNRDTGSHRPLRGRS
jgi:hypothetical protein